MPGAAVGTTATIADGGSPGQGSRSRLVVGGPDAVARPAAQEVRARHCPSVRPVPLKGRLQDRVQPLAAVITARPEYLRNSSRRPLTPNFRSALLT